jgi:hypothetical protein
VAILALFLAALIFWRHSANIDRILKGEEPKIGAKKGMKRKPLSDVERLDWLRLARTSGVGPVTFSKLIERFGDAETAIDALPRLAKRGGRAKPLKPPPMTARCGSWTAWTGSQRACYAPASLIIPDSWPRWIRRRR